MASPIVQFVDSPSTSAALRYDFNVKTPTLWCFPLGADAIDFGVPSFTGEPEGVGGFYGYRSLSFTQRIIGTRAVALARMSLLAKELFRTQNWLRFQWDPTASPVFFKTYHTEPGELSLENAGQADAWDITVPLVADGLAYGPRQTITQAQIIQAPADLTGPTRLAMRYILPAIKGDAPTPLRVTITPAASPANNVGTSSSAWLVGCVAGSTSMSDLILDIGTGDTVTNINGTAAASTDATYFGGSYRTVTIGAGTPNLNSRFSIQVPTTIPIGRYKVLLRCRFTAAAARTLLFRLQYGFVGPVATITTVAGDTGRDFWVDLGNIAVPSGINPPTDAGGTVGVSVVIVDIGTAAGDASSVNVDSVKLIPIDGPTVSETTLMRALGSSIGAATNAIAGTFDGDLETFWSRSQSTGAYIGGGAQVLQGGFPVADPAVTQNLLILMALDSGPTSASGTSYITTLNAQAAVDISYYPQYLHIGDGT